MQDANLEIQQIVERWKALRQARPTEMDFTPWGHAGLNAAQFECLFEYWKETINLLVQRTKGAVTPQDQILELTLLKILKDIRGNIDAAQGNGLAWLVQNTGFIQWTISAINILSPIIEKRTSLRKELLKLASSKINNDLISVEKAAPIAAQLIGYQEQINEEAGRVTALKNEAEKESIAISEIKELASSNESIVKNSVDNATKAESEITTVVEKLKQTLSKAEELLLSVEALKENADKTIVNGEILISQANEKLSKAIENANRQALAGAFSQQAIRIGWERIAWMAAFIASISWLLFVANKVASGSSTTDPNQIFDWHNLIKGLPLAAPAIWLGWLSARSSGMLARIQHDYSYKAATAVAFEGYKKEVASDEALAKQLLETAVRNFGENPIRIYPTKEDHGHPMEALVEMIQDEKRFPKMIEMIKALKPGGKD
jgi:hypothetical protein